MTTSDRAFPAEHGGDEATPQRSSAYDYEAMAQARNRSRALLEKSKQLRERNADEATHRWHMAKKARKLGTTSAADFDEEPATTSSALVIP